jgi:hypothetical protein
MSFKGNVWLAETCRIMSLYFRLDGLSFSMIRIVAIHFANPRSSNVAQNEHDLVADFDNKGSYSSRDSVTSPNGPTDH